MNGGQPQGALTNALDRADTLSIPSVKHLGPQQCGKPGRQGPQSPSSRCAGRCPRRWSEAEREGRGDERIVPMRTP